MGGGGGGKIRENLGANFFGKCFTKKKGGLGLMGGKKVGANPGQRKKQKNSGAAWGGTVFFFLGFLVIG